MKLFILLIVFIPFFTSSPQNALEDDLQILFQNAKKGLYWGLENIPVKKNNIENDLIADNKLYASVKLSKEINGIKIKSTGFYNSAEFTIIVYRSYESLEKEGYIPKGSSRQ
jgi:hypothetical protein